MKKHILLLCTIVCLIGVTTSHVLGQNTTNSNQSTLRNPVGGNALQMKLIEGKTFPIEPDKIKAMQAEQLSPIVPFSGPVNVVQGLDTTFIVLGYQQSDASYDYHYIWPALTHVAASFLYFDATGAFTNLSAWTGRSAELKAGGAAQANGVKVLMTLANSGFSSAVQYSVFTSPTIRQTLVNNVVSAVTSDGYCQGVTFDFEAFIGNTSVRDGITAFTHSLSTTLKAISSSYEVSYYVDAIYSSSEIDVPNISPYLDYVVYSCYDWSVGVSTPTAVSDVAGYVPQINNYLNAGMPANKMVLAISAYSHMWYTSGTSYSSSITSSIGNSGFQQSTYDVTNQPTFSGPYTENYHTGDETGWYTYNDGSGNRIHVIDDTEAMEYKSRMVKSWQDSSDVNNGKKLRGVAFWSLYWTATGSSFDPITHAAASKTRLYPQLFQVYDEVFNPPGNHRYLMEKFEGPDSQRDYRWRDCSESPDSKGYSATLTLYTTSPSGIGQPSYSDNAMRLTFTFASTSGNQLFFRHEVLNDNNDTTVTDTNHCRFYVNRNSKVRAYLYSAGAYSGRDVRMVIMDTTRHVFKSSPYSLSASGWQIMDWDLTDSSQISGYTTAEPAFISGGSSYASSTSGNKDLGFIGFLLEGGTNGTGTVYFDEISYTPTNPSSQNYLINEFSYGNSTQEFIEIYGPAGALPSGMQLRLFDTFTTQAIFTTINLSGTIADAGGGYGYWVVGDTGVANVNQVFGNSASQNMPTTQPSAIQLYNANNGNVYDSVVYQAFGGLRDLIRKQTLGVTQNGYGWLGEVASGTNSAGQSYSMGRYPDGANTWVNETDFTFMPLTPGKSNGGSVSVGATFDFTTAPSYAFQTYQPFAVYNPVSAGLPASTNGGNAYRCVDVTGGGSMGIIGDASLGANSTGYSVTGEIYIPSSSADTDAIAIGICGRQGSNFFTSTKATLDRTGYESGYWLVYENRAGVGLNDGLSDHANTFNFEFAHNDNMDTAKVTLLSAVSLTSTGASAGAWTPFSFSISPGSNLLVAKINNVTVYSGSIPTNGPISGAFQVGFRENHAGAPTTAEGTWIDGLSFSASVPVELSDFEIAAR